MRTFVAPTWSAFAANPHAVHRNLAWMAVQEGGTGDWWHDWLGSSCPALVLHGGASTLLPAELAREMVTRRPAARLVSFPSAGHWIHDDEPDGFARAVAGFLDGLALGI